jgi:hypothetical protein
VLWDCCVCFEPPFGHYISFSSSRGLILQYWNQHSWLWGGDNAKKYDLGLLVVPTVFISIGIVIGGLALEKIARVMTLCVLVIGYSLVRNLRSSASWPTLPGLELSSYLTKERIIRLVLPPCLCRRFSPTVDMIDLQSPCVGDRVNP